MQTAVLDIGNLFNSQLDDGPYIVNSAFLILFVSTYGLLSDIETT